MASNVLPPCPQQPMWDEGNNQNASTQPTVADNAMADRVFHLVRPCDALKIPDFLDPTSMGFALCGKQGEQRIGTLGSRDAMTAIADVAYYEKNVATEDSPFFFPEPDTLFGPSGFFDDMIARSATVVFTPTQYVKPDDDKALKAIQTEAHGIDRRDVVVVLPLDVTWIRDNRIDQLITILRPIPHPIALILGGQYNPTDHYTEVVGNLRVLYRNVGRMGLWRTDLISALDCMASGGMFAGIGASAALRHVVSPGERATTRRGPVKPSVFIPELLGYFRADTLKWLWHAVEPLKCSCRVCHGRDLNRFNSYDGAVRKEAQDHNTASWITLWTAMRHQGTLVTRQAWLSTRIHAAASAYTSENQRIQQARGFTMSKTLRRLAQLSPIPPGA